MSLSVFSNMEFRFAIQIMCFITALIVTQMAVIEWRRNKNTLYKYLALGFGLMFILITVQTGTYVYFFATGKTYSRYTLHVIENTIFTASLIYTAAAFTTVKSSFRSRFIRINFFVLLLFAPLAWISSRFNDVYSLYSASILWELLPFELWHTGLIIHTIIAIAGSTVRMKKGLIIATCLLLTKQIFHFVGIFAVNRFPALSLAENTLFVFYFYAVITTVHNEIISDLIHADMEKNSVKEKAHQDTIRALINSLEAKDEYTRGHSDRVTEYAMVIGEKLGFSNKELTKLYYGAILHDIGKIGISEDILNHPFSLGRDDFDIMKKHPEIGATIVSSIDSLKNIAPSILYHHERFDGSGYPSGLKGHEIPLHARIIAIADSLDAMSSTRSYRTSLTEENAIHELIAGAGTQFDPELVRVFVEALGLDVKELDKKILSRSA